ncbi:MAG: Ig-like domain-containing protein [Actinomycetota bacterium]|nr:Ig-like domain-containing protein [Actinomycetota bacterium]MDQ2956152.1 Ig-like domain-containing protein [Actinomycetota bacterium]
MGNRRKAVAWGSAVIAVALCLSACSQKKSNDSAANPNGSPVATSSSLPTSAAPAGPAVLTISAVKGAVDVSPVVPVKVAVAGGSLASVTLTNPEGKAVKGALDAAKTSWSSAEDLGYGKAYTLKATATNPEGKQVSESRSFTTLTPKLQTAPYIQTAAGGGITPGVTFGVGQVVRIHFDEAIPDRKAAQDALSVTTVPAQVGAFSWLSNTDVYWRTKVYMKPGTKVTVNAKVYGKNLGNSLYGQNDATTWFKVGAKHVSIADDNTKEVKVYSNDKLVKTMPTSMGRHVSIPGDTGPIDLRTNSGPHVVVDGEKNINMNSASFGLSKGANSYKTIVPIGVRISYDGEYVHWADWSVWAQGNTDTSHGCLNVSPADSYWFYDFSVPGDIVDVRNTGRNLAEWNSGYWNVSWAKWVGDGAK